MAQIQAETDTFVPGSYWTAARVSEAVARMTASLESPAMQAVLEQMGADFTDTHGGEQQQPSLHPQLTRDRLRIRRGRAGDVEALAALIAEANLPPLFIEEYVEGFAVAEQDGRIIAAGGLEVYGKAGAFIRSVAVAPEGRGLGLGREIAELLCEDAHASGVHDIYLFTQDAWFFWQHLGFVDIPMDAWPPATRVCWQYRFLIEHPAFMRSLGVHSMWRRA